MFWVRFIIFATLQCEAYPGLWYDASAETARGGYKYGDPVVEFRLTYEGPLHADTNKGEKRALRASEKQRIRKHFHIQLKRLWKISPILAEGVPRTGASFMVDRDPTPHTVEALAERFTRIGYKFVPLVTEGLDLGVSLSVLLLRGMSPGDVMAKGGDIDNRIKTLFDALKMPGDVRQLGEYTTPEADEDPFFCLFEDDKVVNHIQVETDALLDPVNGQHDDCHVRAIITVRLKILRLSVENMGFG